MIYATSDVDCSGFGDFESIGDTVDEFVGSFDGRGFVVSGVSLVSDDLGCLGLFCSVGGLFHQMLAPAAANSKYSTCR